LDLPSLVEEALSIRSSDFVEITEKAMLLLKKEDGQIGNLTVTKHLVKLEPLGEALVIGDLHGDLKSLSSILQKSGFLKKMEKDKDAAIIFLGDYGDRGKKSPEIYYLILKLKVTYPKQVVLLRGNHEAPNSLLGIPHDLPLQFQSRFGEDFQTIYKKIRELHDCLYNAVYVPDRYLMVHGGLSPKIRNIQDIAGAEENQNEALLEDLLWNDPDEELKGVSFSPRGAGRLFGKKVTEEILRRLQLKILIRGHEPSDVGFKINHDGKVLTLFSRKGAPYYNRYGAYLQLPLAEKFENASQLTSFIHKF
jgi:diadenosine tetraphosphatase ApaH/serine/threonine PP2A family protein phosphatase